VKPISVEVELAVVPPNVVVMNGKSKKEEEQAAPVDWTTPALVTWRQLVAVLPKPLMLMFVVEARPLMVSAVVEAYGSCEAKAVEVATR
jgi:hypothetical protein